MCMCTVQIEEYHSHTKQAQQKAKAEIGSSGDRKGEVRTVFLYYSHTYRSSSVSVRTVIYHHAHWKCLPNCWLTHVDTSFL